MPSLLLASKRGDQIIYGLIGGLVFGLIFGLSYDHTTAALVLEEGEGRERGMLKQLGHGQIGLQLCSDLL
jgi:hypothetical protein